MRIAVGSDHRGIHIRKMVAEDLAHWGHDVIDVGSYENEPVDYPDYAALVGEKIAKGEVDRGVLICQTGIGMCIVANKFPGVRAAVIGSDGLAKVTRAHNDINVLCLSVNTPQADRIVSTWLTTEFEGEQHAVRLAKIRHIEDQINSQTC